MIVVFVMLFLTISVTSIGAGERLPVFSLNENQVLYLFSTSSQVVASIYGLTLTAFVFFRTELNREESEDISLTEAVETLKKRYFILLLFITFLVLLSILLANLAIVGESDGNFSANIFVINTAQAAFIVALFAIAHFIFEIAAPDKIGEISRVIQNKIDPIENNDQKGNLELFLRNFNKVEFLLINNSEVYPTTMSMQISSDSYEAKKIRRISNVKLADMIFRSKKISRELFEKLRELITLRNSIIHSPEPAVSKLMVDNSAAILQELRDSLGISDRDHDET